jgi:hypothetical protein
MKLRLSLAPLALGAVLAGANLPAQERDDPTMPGPEHKVLAKLEGVWSANVKAWFMPGKPPEESTATMKRTLILGGRYLREEFEGKFGGEAFSGVSLVGYDRLRKKYVSTWADSMSTGIMISEGTYDADAKSFTYRTDDVDPMTGRKMKGRDLLRFDTDDKLTFEMYRAPAEDGAKEFKLLEIVYTRKK